MSINKESNAYVLGFLTVMVLIVALSLAFVSSALKPRTDQNIRVDKMTKILKTVVPYTAENEKAIFTEDFVVAEFKKNIKMGYISNDGTTQPAEDVDNFLTMNFKEASRKAPENRVLPYMTYSKEGNTYYIIQLIGLGLWDEINGYLALEPNGNVIKGAAFDHVGETPGLGARITDFWYQEQFQGKELYNDAGQYAMDVRKGEKNDLDENEVDGLSGATLTANGLETMLEKCVNIYNPLFADQKMSN